jgi:predicted Holliday junction resolvase-like endonuclease
MTAANLRGLMLFGLLVGVATALLALVWFVVWKARYTRLIREDAVLRSHAVTAGKIYEQLVPYLPGFAFNPRDARFLGSPVDFVIFEGLSEGEVRRIVFVEVKAGGSQLTTREREVRDAVKAGRVEWAELRGAQALTRP